uniref:Serine/threonine-protein kinase haspin n=1 Tax=Malurus cyaneus samueli TaxID=2593467 RepID=A0A8C5X016_9PASS
MRDTAEHCDTAVNIGGIRELPAAAGNICGTNPHAGNIAGHSGDTRDIAGHPGHCGTLRDIAGHCGTLRDTCGTLRDIAGHCGTLRDTCGTLRDIPGHCGTSRDNAGHFGTRGTRGSDTDTGRAWPWGACPVRELRPRVGVAAAALARSRDTRSNGRRAGSPQRARPGPAMPLQPRLLRTYSRRAGYLRPLPPPDRWISPPQDRKRLFSSTTSSAASAASSALSASSAASPPSDDPEFLPPAKQRSKAPGKRPALARRLRTRKKENREPAGKETRGRGKENREPAGKETRGRGKEKWSRKKEPRGRREEPPSLSFLENTHKRTKGVPAEGSTCRKACISGFSASRWGKHTRLRTKKHKNKRQQQPNNSFLRPQVRQKRARKGALEMSVDVRDYSLNSSYSWARVRASLSFHKKKKVTTDESFCNSILCTPSGKSQLSGSQASLSAGKALGSSWIASSMVLLAPRDSCSALELLLTDAEKVFGECNQEGPITFEECIPLDKMKDCKKIGEGVFGEVFQIDSERGPAALKIIPIEGTEKVNGENQKSFGEVLPEVIISKELSLLSEGSVNRTVGFISVYSVHCVQGAYPRYLLEAWDKFHKERGSQNDRPDLFGDQQLFMVLEFEFGGEDLEHMRSSFSSVVSARSILHQVTASLAVAEQELHFEHRDLHWGNVLVKRTDVRTLQYVLDGVTHTIPTAGIHVNIIDYTLSRLEKDGLTVFCDISTDEELFHGAGDYQFDIYRQMKEENSNSWGDYHPHSNVLWLHYLADKLLNAISYKTKKSTSSMKKIKMQLTKFHKEVLTFESAHDVLHHSSLFQ